MKGGREEGMKGRREEGMKGTMGEKLGARSEEQSAGGWEQYTG